MVAVKVDEGKGSINDDFDNSGDSFVVNLFKECNDNKEGAHESKVEAFDSEDENSIIENMAKKYPKSNTFPIQPNSRPKKKGTTLAILTTQMIHSL